MRISVNIKIGLVAITFFTFASVAEARSSIPVDMHLACLNGSVAKVQKFLLKDPSYLDGAYASKTCLMSASSENHTELSLYLISKGADVNIKEPATYMSPFFNAIWHQNLELIEAMFNYGADPHYFRSSIYFSGFAWELAIQTANPKILDLFLKSSWKPCQWFNRGSVVTYAAKTGTPYAVERLATACPNLNDLDENSQPGTKISSSLRAAAQRRFDPDAPIIVKFLLSAGANPNSAALAAAARRATPPQVEVVELLLKAGADPNDHIFNSGPTCAAMNSLEEVTSSRILELLIQFGADVNRRCPTESPWGKSASPIHHAVDHANEKAVRLLAKANANLNAEWVISCGDCITPPITLTPLSIAKNRGDKQMEQLLRSLGATQE